MTDDQSVSADAIFHHVGIIPDGNRRWAKQNNMDLTEAYWLAMQKITACCGALFRQGVSSVSVYLLSKDNILRAREDLQAVIIAETRMLRELIPALKHDLGVIVDGIIEGRKTFANTVTYIRATLLSNFGNFFAVAFASMIIPYLPMLPVQILLLNLLSDFPMFSISTDNVSDKDLGNPKTYNTRDILIIAVFLGIVSTLFDFIIFGTFQRFGEKFLQTNWFIGSVATELALLYSIRTTNL